MIQSESVYDFGKAGGNLHSHLRECRRRKVNIVPFASLFFVRGIGAEARSSKVVRGLVHVARREGRFRLDECILCCIRHKIDNLV